MDLLPSPEQDQIIDSVKDFMSRELPLERIRDGRMAVPDAGQWKAMAELGWFGIAVDPDLGGVGYGLSEEALMLRAAGRYLAPVSLLAMALATRFLAACGERKRLSACLDGTLRLGLAVPETGLDETDGRVSGRIRIIDGHDADGFLLITPGSAVLFDRDQVERAEAVSCLDASATLHVADLKAAAPSLRRDQEAPSLYATGMVLIAALAVGVAEAACDMAVEHAKTREQFGRPIGAFQAVKHPCADMAVRVEAAGTQMCYAALALGEGLEDGKRQAAAARLLAGEAALVNSRASIQIHGALGVTDEYPAHLLLKRAHLLDILFPCPRGALV